MLCDDEDAEVAAVSLIVDAFIEWGNLNARILPGFKRIHVGLTLLQSSMMSKFAGRNVRRVGSGRSTPRSKSKVLFLVVAICARCR